MGHSERVLGGHDTTHHQGGCDGGWYPTSIVISVPLLCQLFSILTSVPCWGKEAGASYGLSIRRQGAGSERQGEAVTPTGLGAEAVLLVAVIVLGGATPAVAIRAALRGAAVVACALKPERELAGLSIAVATQGEQG